MTSPSSARPEPAAAFAQPARPDIARFTLAVLCLLLLIVASLYVLRPFLAALVWATTVVVSTWPLLRRLEARFGGRRAPAVAVMTLAMLLLLIVPLWAAVATVVGSVDQVTALAETLTTAGLPPPPAWISGVPLVGGKAAAAWTRLSSAGPEGLATQLAPYASAAAAFVLGRLGSLGGTLLQFLLVVVLSAILYANGETAGRGARRFGRRLAGERGESSVVLAGQAIRGVALGVAVTAIIQTALGSIGLYAAGVPFAALLSALMLVLCIAQLGPALPLIAAVAWTYWRGEATWGTILLVWSVLVSVLDNFLRPVLIKRGADLPLLLIFAGVIGGLIGFGLVGIFVGPVVLAVSYTLLDTWIEEGLGAPGDAA
jgi:predicted PurR-regulated permease PerM